MSTIKILLVTLMTAAVALAGCTDAGGPADPDGAVDKGPKPIELGTKGAIKGLVVDDNFRPVQLKEDWSQDPGEFQDVGFVLILETGQRYETNENGEFIVVPLDPGTYTIRVAADVHEAKDTTVEVLSGEYAEVTVEARRQYSGGGTVLSQEYVIFAGCSWDLLVNSATNMPCTDQSGDTERAAFSTNYIAVKDDIRGMVVEMRATQEGPYGVQMRYDEIGGCGRNWCLYWMDATEPSEKYLHGVVYPTKAWQRDGTYLAEGQEGYCTVEEIEKETGENCNDTYPPDFSRGFDTIIFPGHPNKEYTQNLQPVVDVVNEQVIPVHNDVNPVANLYPLGLYGAGPVLGIKAQFLHTVFLYELPEEGIQDYCALCDDADIPE